MRRRAASVLAAGHPRFKAGRARADCSGAMSSSHAPNAGEVAARADTLAEAALRELPEALIVVFDAQLRVVVHAGKPLAPGEGRERAQPGQALEPIFPPELWRELERLFRSALTGETRSREVWTAAHTRCLLVDVGPLRIGEADHGEVAGGVAVVRDASVSMRVGSPARAAGRDAFEQVFERAPIATALLDRDWRWLLVNRALCETSGYTAQELLGRPFRDVVPALDDESDERWRLALLAGETVLQAETTYRNAAGETLPAIVSMSLVREQSGLPLHYIAQLQDISERKQLENHLRHLADHDPLTGLRNRRLFDHDLALQVARSRRYGETAGLIVLDLDDFKRVNDEHGHRAGDETLKVVARALRARLRATDLVARIGGDEFAVLLPHMDADGLALVADGVERVVRACVVELGEQLLHPQASVGRALIDSDASAPEDVFALADRETYRVKREQR